MIFDYYASIDADVLRIGCVPVAHVCGPVAYFFLSPCLRLPAFRGFDVIDVGQDKKIGVRRDAKQ